jgi:hypothetical protein
MEKNFLKVGDKILFKPSMDGLEYELEGGKVYNVKYNRFSGDISFETAKMFTLPTKIYSTEKDEAFINKVLDKYKITNSGVLGVMLSGLKGAGKTIMLKQIAIRSELPIVLLDREFPEYKFKSLFQGLVNTEVCFVFDEIDKSDSDFEMCDLLQVLDGMNTVGKKLMLFACNDDKKISEFLKDRCSRVRYWKRFDKMSEEMIKQVVNDRINDNERVNEVSDFIYGHFECVSFDNILSFIDEIASFPNQSLEDLFNDMNLTKK